MTDDTPDVLPAVTESVPVTLGQHFKITAAGLTVTGDPSFELCETFWSALKTLEKSIAFTIGDAILYFENRWGEKASQIIDHSGLAEETCRVYRWMAESVLPENRMLDRGLSVSHHLAVAPLEPSQQQHWLRQALGDGKPWSVNRLRAAINAGKDGQETHWWVLCEARSAKDQADLLKELELSGRRCKAVSRRG